MSLGFHHTHTFIFLHSCIQLFISFRFLSLMHTRCFPCLCRICLTYLLILAFSYGRMTFYLVFYLCFTKSKLLCFQSCTHSELFRCRSLFCGGSTALYVSGFCFYYYFDRSDMSGWMQTSIFFGYMACICYGFFLMLGTAGFYASLFFVRYIYASIKCD